MASPVAVLKEFHQQSLYNLPYEEVDGSSVIITGLPLVKQVYKSGSNLLLITLDGELLLVDNTHPTGVFVGIGIPNLKNIVNRAPFGICDESDKLHFIDFISAVDKIDKSFDLSTFVPTKLMTMLANTKYPDHTQQIWDSVKSQGIESFPQDHQIIEIAANLKEPVFHCVQNEWNPSPGYQAVRKGVRLSERAYPPINKDIEVKYTYLSTNEINERYQ